MKILFVVNDVETEVRQAATIVLATAACRRGHQVYMAGVRQLEYFPDGRVGASARVGPGEDVESQQAFLDVVQGRDSEEEEVTSAELNVIWLRFNPTAETAEDRRWLTSAPIQFGQLALEHGVTVLNHPYSLAWATSKMYFQQFPEAVRPETIITRSYERVAAFHEAHGGRIVVKPLEGHGGTAVFKVGEGADNLKQIVEAVTRDSYLLAQEYLPGAEEGDTRLFMVNGKLLEVDGRYAALRRRSAPDDFRSNMSAGGKPELPDVDDRMLELARVVGPKLVKDGIFFAGLDVVGDKLVEINTISAGGLNIAGKLHQRDFGVPVIEAVERKVFYKRHYGEHIRNIEIATLD